ncbi:MAG: hypothetical protein KAG64_02760 [Bacteroidales bacterium]|nr:hypothetical protein [Bacteroidales bacterium]
MQLQYNQEKYNDLRKTYQEFVFEGFDYNFHESELRIVFHFRVDKFVEFNPKITIPKTSFLSHKHLSKDYIELLIFHIGMIELISYWKAICTTKIIVKDFFLTEKQIAFWKKIYFHGLGEFFYLNSIDTNIDDFVEIVSQSNRKSKSESLNLSNDCIIPVGGGKDSVVSLELLKNRGGDNLALIMNPRGASSATANIAGFEGKTIIIKRFLDQELLELNKKGFLNGHTPFSALLGFVTVLSASLSQKKYIALSNESSANESTVIGTDVNHQYSKSFEFEKDFRNYVHEFISPDIEYFSLLRPISEFQIASLFAKSPQYFYDFKSCNVGSKQNIWCGACSKCLFTFIILSPFMEPDELKKIFGNNLLDDANMMGYFEELTGIADVKPFECVGTVEEVNAALCLSIEKYSNADLPVLLRRFKESELLKDCILINKEELLSKIETEHFLEQEFEQLIVQKLNK